MSLATTLKSQRRLPSSQEVQSSYGNQNGTRYYLTDGSSLWLTAYEKATWAMGQLKNVNNQPSTAVKTTINGKSAAPVKAYKGTRMDGTCHGSFKYEVGKTYVHKGRVKTCYSGFHACRQLTEVDGYYSLRLNQHRFFEVELSGEIDEGSDKLAASHLRVVRELPYWEIVSLLQKEGVPHKINNLTV